MDPVTALGAAGSVVGIASFGIQLSQILIRFISQIRSAQESLEATIEEIERTASALREIYRLLEQEVVYVEGKGRLFLFSGSSLTQVKKTADRCLVVFWRVEATISGSYSQRIEEDLVRKLADFNQSLGSYRSGSPIQIESELDSGPLGLWDKLSWPKRASKLDKYCTQLQRYQDNLVLLLQIVSLGQQKLKRNPTQKDAELMVKTYTIISQVVTPEELRIIASRAKREAKVRRGNEGQMPSSLHLPDKHAKVGHRQQESYPSFNAPVPQHLASHKASTANLATVPSPTEMEHTQAKAVSSDRQDHINEPKTNGYYVNPPHASVVDEPGRPVSQTQIAEHPTHKPISPAQPRHTQHTSMKLEHKKTDPIALQTLSSANNSIAGGDKPGIKEPNIIAPNQSQPGPAEQLTNKLVDAGHNQEAAPQQFTMLKQQEGDQQLLQNDDSLTERRDDLETTRKSETRPRDDKNNLPGELTDPKTQILPYVIHDGGAYQLPVLLSSKDRDDLLRGAFWRPSGKVLTEKLALLSPAEVQTIRNILRKNQTHPYNLSHLAVVKTSRLKFWQKQKRVMVAFIEGEQSDISSDLLTTTELIPGNADAKYMPADSVPRGQVIEKTLTDVAQFPQVSNHIGPSAPHIHSSQSPVEYIETSRNRPEQAGLRPHTDAGSLSNRLELVQRSDKQGEGEGRGLPLYQDITQLLGSEDSHHAIPQKYRVWTVQPYKIPGKGQASPSDWTRCILSEEFLNAVLIEQKLQIIEKKDSRTALQKMATLPTHQQLQISRSIEAVRRSDSDSNFQWSLRQLEIIQSKGVFRAKRIKAIIVYAYGKPFMEMGPTRPQEDENRDTWLPGHISGPYSRPNIEAENYTSKRPSSILAPVSHRKDEERQKTHSISDKSNATAERSDTAERYDTDEERKRARRLRFSAKEQEVNQRILPARLLHQAEEANRRIANRTPMPRPVKISSPLSSMNDKLTGSSKMLSPQSSVAVRKRMFRPDTDVSSSSGEESSQPSERFIMSSRRLEDVPMSRPSRLKPRTVEPKQDAGQLALRWYDRRPSSRSHSTRRQRDEPGLLHWHDDNGLGARILYPLRESYPAHFDRQPYNPQPLVQKAVEQLLLEWTPVQENQDNPENDVADETMPEDSEADSEQFILANEHPTENRVPQQTAVSNDGLRDFVSGIKRRATEDGVDFAPEYWVTRYGPMSASPQPINRLPRQSTADSNTFPKQLETNTHRNVQGKLAESEAKAGIDLGTTPKVKGSTTIPRASTVPLPERQAWSNVNWAKQIVEETAMAPEDQDNPILPRRQSRQLSTEETLIERGLSGRWRDEAEFFPRTAPSRRRTRDRAKDTLRRERSFERVPEPPMRYAAELDEKPDRRGTLRNQLYSIDQNDSSYRSTAGNNDERRHSRSTRKDSRVLDR